MQIVIEIPEEIYESSKRECERNPKLIIDTFTYAIGTGISLPKGHGRLIDADAISLDDIGFFSISDHQKMVHKLTTSCQTIIESDKEQK